jgi:hypothetical protein
MTRFIFAMLVGILPTIVACGIDDADIEDPIAASDEPTAASDDPTAASDDPTAASDDPTTASVEPTAASDDPTTASVVQASEAQDQGKKVELWFTDDGLALTAHGKLEHLDDKKDVLVTLEAKAKAVARCTNPGGHDPPGQNPVLIEDFHVTGSVSISRWHIKYGKLTFSVKTQLPHKLIPGAPDCPNPNWKETLVDLKFERATLTIKQEGKPPLVVRCTFSKPTTDGPVPKAQVTCTVL